MCHNKKRRNCIPNNNDVISADPHIPTRQKIHHPSKHNPLYPKHLKNHNPQLSSSITMKKKMIWGFFTHTIEIYHYDVTLAEIIQSENFPKGSSPSE